MPVLLGAEGRHRTTSGHRRLARFPCWEGQSASGVQAEHTMRSKRPFSDHAG